MNQFISGLNMSFELDVQGFSHVSNTDFEQFHAAYVLLLCIIWGYLHSWGSGHGLGLRRIQHVMGALYAGCSECTVSRTRARPCLVSAPRFVFPLSR